MTAPIAYLARAAACLAVVILPPVAAATSDGATPTEPPGARQTLVFTALLDGKPIGEHRYRLTVDAGTGVERLQTVAAFDVKFLGITAYRYRHADSEAWTSAGCVAEMTSSTDDGGDTFAVHASTQGNELAVDAPAGPRRDAGCVVSYPLLYWHAGSSVLLRPTHLLNPQDGVDHAVQVSAAPDGSIAVHGTDTPATHLRVTRKDGPIDLWYGADGAWIGLDATVKGRRLSYRLK